MDESDLEMESRPMGPVALPQSITQQDEESSLKKRFGVDELPEISHTHDMVRMQESGGITGPDRSNKGMFIAALLLLLVGGGALLYYAYSQGMLDTVLKGQ